MMEWEKSIDHFFFPVLCHYFAERMILPGDMFIILQVLCQSSKEDIC